jgi:hypothetical protein
MPSGNGDPFVAAEAVSAAALEFVTQRELDGPWIHRPLELTEGLRRLQAQARTREVRMIKDVEGLGSNSSLCAPPRGGLAGTTRVGPRPNQIKGSNSSLQ